MPTQVHRWKPRTGLKHVLLPCAFHLGQFLGLIALIVAASSGLRGQISPGPLSKVHQSLSGSTQCTACHKMGGGSTLLKCQECHTEIAREISGNRGLHARYPNNEDCAKCHSEHNGEDFPLIHWQPSLKGFDHNQTGYQLQGKHAGIECSQCHVPAHISASERPFIKMKDLRQTFLGLSQTCVTCHEDVHHSQLGQNCLQCHTFVDWKAATKIDHSKTRFPLTGLHAQVACSKCHAPAEPGGAARFTGMAFAKCSDCHSDPHHGSFAQSCEMCHTTNGWKKIPAAEQFDHSKTKFPLLGKHVQLGCTQCHTQANFKKPVAFATCAGCHTPDPHGGQFAARRDKGECAACHTVDGWKPATFGVKEHATAAYSLQGKHAAVACAACHVPAGAATRYALSFAQCTDCHKDAHDRQFAAAPYRNQCEQCHTVAGFQPSTYTIAQHQKTRFRLVAAHLAVTCSECHVASKTGDAAKVVPYHFEDRSCTGCHTDPHHGEFRERMAQRRPDGSAAGCEACHTLKSWTDLPSFDHSKTSFPLLGAHAKVQCDQCHQPSPGGRTSEVTFRTSPTKCAECHSDVHAGQFAASSSATKCETCHTVDQWKPSHFDHEKQTDFSLKGAHEKVACTLCHSGLRNIDGKRVLFYKPTARQCAACHN